MKTLSLILSWLLVAGLDGFGQVSLVGNASSSGLFSVANGFITTITSTDNFVRTAANPISSPMSDGVSTWTSPVSTSATVTNGNGFALGIINGQANMAIVNSPTHRSYQSSEVTFGPGSFAFSGMGAMVRINGSGLGYMAYADSTTVLDIYKVALSGTTFAGSSLLTSTVGAIGAGFKLKLVANGTTLSCYTNGVLCFSTTDSTYSSGQPGIYFSGGLVAQCSLFTGLSP